MTDTETREERPLRDVVKHTLIYGSGFVTMALVGLVLTPVYAFHLNPSDFGLLALLLALYGVMSQVYDLGFTNSVGRFFFDTDTDPGEARRQLQEMASTGLLFMFSYGGLLTALLWFLAPSWSQLLTGSASHADLVRIVAMWLYAEGLAIVALTLIRMEERSVAFVVLTVFRFAVTLGLNVTFVAVFEWGVRGVLLGNALSAVAILLALIPEYRRRLGEKPSWPLLQQMLRFGLPFFPVLVSAWLIDASDRYIVAYFRSRQELGYYALAYRVAQVMQIAVAAFSMGWAPLRYRIFERGDAKEMYRRLTTYYVLATSLLGVGLAALAAPIISIIAPPSYAPAAAVVPLIVLAYAVGGLYVILLTGMGVSKRTGPMAWVGAIAAVANIGLNLLIVPYWGIHGAAATWVLANAILAVGVWVYSERVYPIPYDWPKMAHMGGLAVGLVAIHQLVAPRTGVPGIAWGVVTWVAFVVALFVTGAVHRSDVTALRSWASDFRSGLRERVSNRQPTA